MASKNSNIVQMRQKCRCNSLKRKKQVQTGAEESREKKQRKKQKELESRRELDEQIDGSSASVVIVTLLSF